MTGYVELITVPGDYREPFDRQKIEGLTKKELLMKAEELLINLHGQLVWCDYPTACLGSKDFREGLQRVTELTELEEILGAKLLEGVDITLPDDHFQKLCRTLGKAFVEGYYHDLIVRQDRELAAWHDGNWSELCTMGAISEDDYQEFSQLFPNGNPWRDTRKTVPVEDGGDAQPASPPPESLGMDFITKLITMRGTDGRGNQEKEGDNQ